jgi:hypothetical protein
MFSRGTAFVMATWIKSFYETGHLEITFLFYILFHATNLIFEKSMMIVLCTGLLYSTVQGSGDELTGDSTVQGRRGVMCQPTLSEWGFLVQVCSYIHPIGSKVHPEEE